MFLTEEYAENKDNLFTIGELAAIYRVPKPTLIHYYRDGLLVPACKNPVNGYNYYSVRQFLTLDIILSLRALEVPIKEIKAFLAHKSPDALADIVRQKEAECRKRVGEIERLASRLRQLLRSIEQTCRLPVGIIEVAYQPPRLLKAGPLIKAEMTHSERAATFINHNQSILQRLSFNGYPTGWIVKSGDFFGGRLHSTCRYFTLLEADDAPPDTDSLPDGLYLSLRFRGTYYQNAHAAQEKISLFLERNKIRVLGDVYNLPLRNHWQTDDTDDYLYCLFMRVEYT